MLFFRANWSQNPQFSPSLCEVAQGEQLTNRSFSWTSLAEPANLLWAIVKTVYNKTATRPFIALVQVSMIIVFDSNIWLSQLGLRSPVASAVRFFLKQNNYPVALPEVIRLEVEGNLETALIKHINAIDDAHRQLLTVFGTLKEVVLPTGEEVRTLVQRVFSSSGVNVIEVPLAFPHVDGHFR